MLDEHHLSKTSWNLNPSQEMRKHFPLLFVYFVGKVLIGNYAMILIGFLKTDSLKNLWRYFGDLFIDRDNFHSKFSRKLMMTWRCRLMYQINFQELCSKIWNWTKLDRFLFVVFLYTVAHRELFIQIYCTNVCVIHFVFNWETYLINPPSCW